ncbi:hypothetical protein AGABI1DRAFT_96937 [Agaricus bisporus var. burnettii JB137-S8]|uniref:RRM domain-containing protein n=1 Tax=Agaricus bisporus var. burnettii (strain JB137-S8 / ATCC MYA-4627 / FGSC 10392) TaxID=597362 RepID=K5XKR5_AGABU|nr:uncharacterized protein AGABI1DRAFT_96937 [Agaricus bisporus var. burnettii JB137-S8]EKM83987.1 hypothetical protein AGABI1DRAFT_96937 [Agaricus bisporus var. burnettii JB137-S8]
MNRHHPYGGSFEGHRRGGSPSGPGPDRPHRFQERSSGGHRGRGGFGRGRGGGRNTGADYGSYDGGIQGGYDQVNDMDAYNEYDSQAPVPQRPFYQNAPYPSYNQGYGKFEDGATNDYDDDGSGYSRGPRRPVRKDRDDKVHDSIIEERIQRERPCRTLFIRNIKYETNSDDVRRQFEEFGSIKTFFDLISTRGMVFVTYFDLRAAERARDRLQGSEISGRPIDVHYSLPRDDQKGPERERNQQFQGTIQVTLRASPSGQPIDDNEVRRKFQSFGDIKSVRPVNDRIDSRYVEFYDIRNCEDAFNALRHQGLQDGVMDIVYAWDNTDGQSDNRLNGASRDWDGGENYRGRGGGRGRGRGRGRGGHSNNDWGDRRDYGRDRESRRGRHEDSHSGRGGRYDDRYDDRGGYGGPGYGGSQTPTSFVPPPMSQPPAPSGANMTYGSQVSYADPGQPDDRLEQARKVQQLLAALKQPGGTSAASVPNTTTPPIPSMPAPASSMPPFPPYPPASTLSQPPYPSSLPPSSAYTGVPPPTVPQMASQPPPNSAGLPPNIMALLHTAQQLWGTYNAWCLGCCTGSRGPAVPTAAELSGM